MLPLTCSNCRPDRLRRASRPHATSVSSPPLLSVGREQMRDFNSKIADSFEELGIYVRFRSSRQLLTCHRTLLSFLPKKSFAANSTRGSLSDTRTSGVGLACSKDRSAYLNAFPLGQTVASFSRNVKSILLSVQFG